MNALLIAAYEGHVPAVFCLLACGANFAAKCNHKLSAIDYAKKNKQYRQRRNGTPTGQGVTETSTKNGTV